VTASQGYGYHDQYLSAGNKTIHKK